MDHLDAELVSVETHIEELEREINKLEEGDTKTSKKRKRQLDDEDNKVRLDQERGYTIETLAKMSKSSGSKGEKVFRCVECAFQVREKIFSRQGIDSIVINLPSRQINDFS